MPVKRRAVSYEIARRYVRNLFIGFHKGRAIRITTFREWREYVRGHAQYLAALRVPTRPDVRYKKDRTWQSWQHFLSQSETIEPKFKKFAGYVEWLDWIRQQPIKSKADYERWCRENRAERQVLGFPANPALNYKEFKGWRDVFQKPAESAGRPRRLTQIQHPSDSATSSGQAL